VSDIEIESAKCFTSIIDELQKLFNREMVPEALVVLKNLLESKSIDTNMFVIHGELFLQFLDLLEDYEKTEDRKIIGVLESRATDLIKITNEYISRNKALFDWGAKIDEQYKKLEKGCLDIKNQQYEISKLNEIVINSQNEANRIIEELKNKNFAYNQLIDEHSNSQIGQLYIDIYSDEIKIADKYRNWALGIFAIIGTILILGFLNISIQNWNHLRDSTYIHIPLGWESLIKTLMLFSLTTPAWYLARESSKHRKVAYKARMLGTELASFPLYAREFKDEDRLELRKHLADRFFGQELYNDSKADSNSDNSLEQVKLLTEANKVLAESFKMKKSVENS